jgi:hypothetical protein
MFPTEHAGQFDSGNYWFSERHGHYVWTVGGTNRLRDLGLWNGDGDAPSPEEVLGLDALASRRAFGPEISAAPAPVIVTAPAPISTVPARTIAAAVPVAPAAPRNVARINESRTAYARGRAIALKAMGRTDETKAARESTGRERALEIARAARGGK